MSPPIQQREQACFLTFFPAATILRMTRSALLCRPAHENDAAAVAAVYAPYVRETAVSFETEPPSPAVMGQRIRETMTTHPWLVAERGGEIVGFSYAGKHSQRAAYRWTVDATIYVSQQERRSGIGRALYAALTETLRWQGFRSVFAEIVLPNPGSARLHEALGFRQIGIHKDIGFKLGRWHDIGYWRLGLADGAAPPTEPISFAIFQRTPALAEILARAQQGAWRISQTPTQLLKILPDCWSIETSSQWLPDNPARGQCNVTSLVVQDLCGGDILKTEAPGGWHFYNRVEGSRCDLTASQFASPIDYADIESTRAEALAGTTAQRYAALKLRVHEYESHPQRDETVSG